MAEKPDPKDIGEYKVSNTRVCIPKDVVEINDVTTDLEVEHVSEIIVEEGNPAFASADGVLFDKSLTTLLACPKGKKGNYVIPRDTVTINEMSFYECLGITSVEIPSSVKIIGEDAFCGCKNLQSVNMHDGLEKIEKSAFSKCALKAVVIPKTVKHVEHEAFSCCPDITVFDSIDPSANMCCNHIDTLNGNPNSEVGFIGIGPALAMWECAANHILYDYVITVLSAQTGQVKYKVWMDMACSQRSYYCLLTSAWGRNASFCFSALDNFFPKIKSVDLKLKVALRRMKYPYDLTPEKRETYLSYVSKNAKTIILGLIDGNDMETLLFCGVLGIIRKDQVSEMIEYAISLKNTVFTEYLQNYQLEKFGVLAVMPKSNTPKASEREPSGADKDQFSPGEIRRNWAFENNADGTLTITDYRGEGTELIIPARVGDAAVTRIAQEAFSPLKSHRRTDRKLILKNVTRAVLPDSMIEIGEKAFFGCVSLKDINLVNPPAAMGRDLLTGCTKLYDKDGLLIINGYLYHSKTGRTKTELRVPEGVHTILPYAFYEKQFSKTIRLSLPSTLKRIGSYAFYKAGRFAQLIIPEGVETIGISAFERCNIQDARLVVPGRVRRLENAAFRGCCFEEIWISEGVETVGDECFDSNRVTLHLPASLKVIGSIVEPEKDYKLDFKQRISDLQVIHGPRGGTAQVYAGKYGFKFAEETAAQPPSLRDSDYAAVCRQRLDRLLNGLSMPLSYSGNHGGLLQSIVFLAAESLDLMWQFYEEFGRLMPRFVIDDTVDLQPEVRLREVLAGSPRNADGQLSLGKYQYIVDVRDAAHDKFPGPQIQLVAKNVSRRQVRVYWRVYKSSAMQWGYRMHQAGQEMGKEE